MNKKGQFFLVAAAIIIAVILGLNFVYNSAITRNEEVAFYTLAQEFRYEMNKVVEHGKYYDLSEEQIGTHLEQISDSYGNSYLNTDFLNVFPIGQNLNFILYSNNLEDVSILLDDSPLSFVEQENRKFKATSAGEGNKITLKFNDEPAISKDIFLERYGNYFFIVLKKEKDGERYVAFNE